MRCQADVLNSPLVLVARTDAEAATMIDSNIEPRRKGVLFSGRGTSGFSSGQEIIFATLRIRTLKNKSFEGT